MKRQILISFGFILLFILGDKCYSQQRLDIGYVTGNLAHISYAYYPKDILAIKVSTSIGNDIKQFSFGMQTFLGKSAAKTVKSFYYETEFSFRKEELDGASSVNKFLVTPTIGYLFIGNLKKKALVSGVFVNSGLNLVYSQLFSSIEQNKFQTDEGPLMFLSARLGFYKLF